MQTLSSNLPASQSLKPESTGIIGWLFLLGALGVLIPFSLLGSMFEYPAILRQDTGAILTRFHKGGVPLILTWFAFALAGLPLLPAYMLLQRHLPDRAGMAAIATRLGVIGLVVQLIGLLRWTFVVPVLANSYVQAPDEATKAAAVMAFKTIHQFAGVILGEHLGQLLTIVWTVLVSYLLGSSHFISRWMMWLGIVSAVIYFMAQAELLATVIPGFPVWTLAGLIGSSLWLIWLIILGVHLLRKRA